jgi:glycosyltransferase involved in cell wall biosynthesis
MKKLSIIIPVYNEKKTIEKILSRIVDLNLGDIAKEVVIVDDGSVDGTRNILRKYEKVFKVFYLEKNSGKGSCYKNLACLL